MKPSPTDKPTAVSQRDFLILLALTEGPRHGYALLRDVMRLTEGEVKFDPANLYRSAKKMIEQALIEPYDTPEDVASLAGGNAARRQYFAITKKGLNLVRAEAARMDRLARFARSRKLIPEPGSRG